LQHFSVRRATPPAPEPQLLEIDGRAVTLRFRRNASAKRMVLRLDGTTGGLVMTLPKRTSLNDALRFTELSRDWISRTLGKQPEPTKLVDGSSVLYHGRLHVVHISGGPRGVVQVIHGALHVPGKPEHASRRLKDFLVAEAERELASASRRYADAMEAKFTRISIRDQKSRWGSCSAGGVLSYSWRLVLAPPEVLDYVAAHEVAHLREMNHGPRFWRLLLTHCPHARTAKQWLKAHGREVHQYL
jgi:predicted metal-dependent hydrolase